MMGTSGLKMDTSGSKKTLSRYLAIGAKRKTTEAVWDQVFVVKFSQIEALINMPAPHLYCK